MQQVSVFVERLNSLSNYQAYIHIPERFGGFLRISGPNQITVHYSSLSPDVPSFTYQIHFPDPLIEGEFQYTTVENEYIQCKIKYKQEGKGYRGYESCKKVPAPEEFTSIVCRECDQPLLKLDAVPPMASPLKRVLALPSEYWVELSELWVCHNPENFQHFPRGALTAKEGHCLVAATYIMVPDSMVNGGSLKDLDSQEMLFQQEYEPICCSNCSSYVGLSNEHYLARKKKVENVTYKLFKYTLRDSASELFMKHQLENKLAEDIYALVQARSCYRVLVFGLSSTFYLQVCIMEDFNGL